MTDESGEDSKEPIVEDRLLEHEEESDEKLMERLSKKKVGELFEGVEKLLSGLQTMEGKMERMERKFEKALSATKNEKRKSKSKAKAEESDEDSNLSFSGIFARQRGNNESDDDDSESSDSEDDSDEKHSGNLRKFLGTEFKHVNPIRGSHYSGTKAKEKAKKEKRKSMLYSEVKRSDSMFSNSKENNMLRMQPSFDHIKLEKLNIPAVIRFFRQLSEYQEKYKISLRAGPLMDKKVIDHMLADNEIHQWEYHEFYQLGRTEIYQLLQNALKPTTMKAFEKNLVAYLDFGLPPNFVPSVTNFRHLFRALISYRTAFMELYDFMSWENKRNVPPCTNKPGGLIKIFISKIVPASLGENIVQGMKRLSKYTRIEDFLDAFYDAVSSAQKKCTNKPS